MMHGRVALARVKRIRCQVGKGGTLTPVADITPVMLSGTRVEHIGLHNERFVNDKGIREGRHVTVHLAGEVIPQVMDVVEVRKFP